MSMRDASNFYQFSRARPASCAGDAPLAALHATPFASAFHAWFGGSGRRYVTTVFPIDHNVPDGAVPDLRDCVLLVVDVQGSSRQVLDVRAIEGEDDLSGIARAFRESGAGEWHVHLLGECRDDRAAIADDIRQRWATTPLLRSA